MNTLQKELAKVIQRHMPWNFSDVGRDSAEAADTAMAMAAPIAAAMVADFEVMKKEDEAAHPGPRPVERRPATEYDPTRPEWARDVLLTFVYLLLRDVGPIADVRDALVEAVRIGAPGRDPALTDRELAAFARRVIARADIEAMPSTPEFDG